MAENKLASAEPAEPVTLTGNALVFDSLLQEKGQSRAQARFEIVPHPDAPLFSQANAQENLSALVASMSEKASVDSEMLEILRQAGLVNLWFFLKFIAGYANPFDQINWELHLDMCNFRQTLLTPGTRGGMFIPRGHYKSTVVTEGGTAWELLRNPDLRVRITNATAAKAEGFMHSVRAIFDSNELVKALYPEHCPAKKTQARWNDTEMVMPNRSKHFREASVEAGGVGGASEGHHYDLHVVDDIVGLGDLNAMSQSGTTMEQARRWFWGSEKPLLVSVRKSRVIVVGTRYAVDDVYDDIVKKSYQIVGAPMAGMEDYGGSGSWKIYYRKGIENGEVIFPENFDLAGFREMAKDNWWTFVTQYLNDPFQAGLAEFTEYDVPLCWLDWDSGWGKWFVLWQEGERKDLRREPLDAMDVVMAVDPAATERYVSAKTSRTAVGVLACHWSGKKFLVDLRVGYVSPTQMFDWMFELAKKFNGAFRGTFLEANAGFKVLGPLVHEEERRRGAWLNLRAAPAFGEKVARIRAVVQPELDAGRLYVAEGLHEQVLEEAKSFPQGTKKDILDMMSNAIANVHVPDDPEELVQRQVNEEGLMAAGRGITGY